MASITVKLVNGVPTLKPQKGWIQPAIGKKKNTQPLKVTINSKSPRAKAKVVDWKKVAKDEEKYLRAARGLTPHWTFVRGGKCSPK